ncbi:family 16 glycosylhydrolase [Candidatus Sumerlaeota bacterium]|nr:family 16 glycosylhydrolase [Candidatus Sumerlaeota bacterium]
MRRIHRPTMILAIFLFQIAGLSFIAAKPPQEYNKLVFSDDFLGSTLDESKWGYNYSWNTYHNHRANMRPEQVKLADGILTLTAVHERSIWNPMSIEFNPFGHLELDYSSGAVHTDGRFRFTHGYAEARIKMPPVKSTWPAFWTLQGGWPPEIDILEVINDRTEYHQYFHYRHPDGWSTSFGGTHKTPDLSADFHVFGFEWTEDTMAWYFDNQEIRRQTNAQAVAQAHDMYLILNLAVGGWAQAPDPADYPTSMYVDWVRVWQKGEIVSGSGGSAQYDFEQNMTDSTGNGNDAVLTGGRYTGGMIGYGLELNGAESYVSLPANLGKCEDITFAAWLKWDGGDPWQHFFDFGSGPEQSIYLSPQTAGWKLRFKMKSGATEQFIEADPLPTGKWTHVAVTLQGDTGKLFVNGEIVGTNEAMTLNPSDVDIQHNYIGRSLWPNDPFFDGRVDDFRVYDRALTDAEIAGLAKSVNTPPSFAVLSITKPDATEDAMYSGSIAGEVKDKDDSDTIRYSKAEGPEWLTVSENGALSGTPTAKDVGINVFTVQAMDNHGSLDDVTLNINVLNTNDPPAWRVDTVRAAGAVEGQPYSASISSQASDIDPDDTLTFAKVSGPDWLDVSGGGVISGSPTSADLGANSFVVRVTDKAGESAEVPLRIEVTQKKLALHYEFEGNLLDSSSENHHGTTFGSPTYIDGPVGRALLFDGVDDYVCTPEGAANFPAMTIATWVRWDGGDPWQRIFDFGEGTSQYLYLTTRSRTNVFRFAIRNSRANEPVEAQRQLITNQWVHVAATVNNGSGALYVNGAVVATGDITLNPTDVNQVENYIGKSQWANDAIFKGAIDDFRIYNYALSADEILALPGVKLNNNPPNFTEDPLSRADATEGVEYFGQTLAGAATDDGMDRVVFRKVDGPSWLKVAENGALSGAPGANDSGPNAFTVRATDATGASADAKLKINVGGKRMELHYRFEGDVNDLSGQNRHGTVSGNPAYGPGKTGQAILFDGMDDCVNMPEGAANFSDLTVTAWVYWEGGGPFQRIFDFGNGTTEYLYLTPSSGDGKFRFSIRSGNSKESLDAASQLPIGEWTHVAVTLNGNMGALYVNGSLSTSGEITLNPTDVKQLTNYIGDSQWPDDPFFKGRIDDFRIYNYALSASDLTILMNSGDPLALDRASPRRQHAAANHFKAEPIMAVHMTNRGAADQKTAKHKRAALFAADTTQKKTEKAKIISAVEPVLNYTFDDDVDDHSQKHLNGEICGKPAYIDGKNGKAIQFNGSDDYVKMPPDIARCNDFTVTTWVKWAGGDPWQRIFDFGADNKSYMFLTPCSMDKMLRFGISTNGYQAEQRIETSELPADQWIHVAVTLSGDIGKLYVNGVFVAFNTIELNPSDIGQSVNYIGKSQWQEDPLFKGSIDDFHIYDYALSSSEIIELNGLDPPPENAGITIVKPNSMVLRYTFDENVKDASIYNMNAIPAGSLSFTEGKLAKAVVLDGDDYISLPDNIASSADFTVAAWIKWNGGDPWQRIFDFGDGGGKCMFLSPRSDIGTLRFAITNNRNRANEQRLEAARLPADQWTHVAVTLNGNTGKLFVDGEIAAFGSILLNPSDINPSKNFIGKSQYTDPLFRGQIDDFRIYNFALSDSNVADLAATSQDR